MISPKQRGIRLTDEEWEAVQQAAEREDRSAAEWSRVTLMRATTQQPISPKQVSSQRERLEALGFPKFMATLDGYDKAAVDRWLDQMSGLILEPENTAQYADAWSRAVRNDASQD